MFLKAAEERFGDLLHLAWTIEQKGLQNLIITMTFASHTTVLFKLFYDLHSTWRAESCCQTEHLRPPLPPPPLSPVAAGSGRHWPAAAPYYCYAGPRR